MNNAISRLVEMTRLNALLSVRWKVVIPFLFITVLVVAVLLPITTAVVAHRIEDEADRRLSQIAESVAALIERSESQVLLSANFVANLPEVEAAKAEKSLLEQALAPRKEELGLQELSYYTPDFQPGDPALYYGGPTITRFMQVSEHTTRIRDALIQRTLETGQAISGIAIAPQSSQIIGVAPVHSMDRNQSETEGVVLAVIFFNEAFVAEISEVLGTDIGVIKDNAVIASTIDRASGYELLLQEGFIDPSGEITAQNIQRGDGIQQRLLAHALILDGEPQGTVLVARSLNDLFQVRQDIQVALIIFAGVVAIASLIFGLAVVLYFARPLSSLVEATSQVSAGKLDQHVTISYFLFKDEITVLSEYFNIMTERLQELYANLERRTREQERIEHELRIARRIQQLLLPKEVPTPAGWQAAAYYQPAYDVGGDFYDFLELPDGRLGLIIGDVSDKGMPAALVMATTRSMLRAAALQLVSPSQSLQRVNQLLCPDIPPNMFVTCLYAVLDPASGRLEYANAGHNLPCRRTNGGVAELRATGMPLGLMSEINYEEKETTLTPGESLLLYSDGLVEAHNPQREMFGLARLQALIQNHLGGKALIDFLLAELATFTGGDWEQEDDVTLVTFEWSTVDEAGVTARHKTL